MSLRNRVAIFCVRFAHLAQFGRIKRVIIRVTFRLFRGGLPPLYLHFGYFVYFVFVFPCHLRIVLLAVGIFWHLLPALPEVKSFVKV